MYTHSDDVETDHTLELPRSASITANLSIKSIDLMNGFDEIQKMKKGTPLRNLAKAPLRLARKIIKKMDDGIRVSLSWNNDRKKRKNDIDEEVQDDREYVEAMLLAKPVHQDSKAIEV